MAGKLAREYRVVRPHLLLDEGVPDAAHHRLASGGGDGLLAHLGGTQVVEAHGPRVRRDEVLGDEGGCKIHRYDVALLVEEARAVGVAVVCNGKVVLAGIGLHKRLEVRQRLALERVRVVVREVPVVFPVEGVVGHPGTGEGRRLGDAHAVGEVKGEVQGALHVGELPDMLGIGLGDVLLPYRSRSRRRIAGRDSGCDALDVLDARRAGDGDCVRLAELAAVPFLRVVRSRYHHAAVSLEKGVGEVAHRRRGEPNVDYVHALVHKPLRKRREERIARLAAVARDDDPALAGYLAEPRVRTGDPVEVVLL